MKDTQVFQDAQGPQDDHVFQETQEPHDKRWFQDNPVWYVSAEATPFAKVGGLGDVAGELPLALVAQGVAVVLCLPLHGGVALPEGEQSIDIKGLPGWVGPGTVHQFNQAGRTVLFFELPRWFGREPIYGWTDDNERFAAFCLAVACHASHTQPLPGLLHLQDWHTASLALLIHAARTSGPEHPLRPLAEIRTLLSIHSLQYQGWHNRGFSYLFDMGFEMDAIAACFQDGYQALRAGILWADALGTVSPTHAEEMLLPGGGFGLETALQTRVNELPQGFFRGILNRLDPSWNPVADTALSEPFSMETLWLRERNRIALHEELGLVVTDQPLLSFVGRLTAGKGLELLESAAPDWLRVGMKLVILGMGEADQEAAVARLAEEWPSLVVWKQGYYPSLARRIYGGADMLLMPSEREACGISQQIAMRYGCVPVARRTGGLADTIEDGITGFLFEHHHPSAFHKALARAYAAYGNRKQWRQIMRTAMAAGGDWTEAAAAYLAFYKDIMHG